MSNELVGECVDLENKLIKYGVSKDFLTIKKEECLRDYLPEALHTDPFAIDYFYRMYIVELNKVYGERIAYLTEVRPNHVNEHVHKRYGNGRMRVEK